MKTKPTIETLIGSIKSKYGEQFKKYYGTLGAYIYAKPDKEVHEYLYNRLETMQTVLTMYSILLEETECVEKGTLAYAIYLAAVRVNSLNRYSYEILYGCYDLVYGIPDGEYGEGLRNLLKSKGYAINE